jgi:hypothetical protein
VLFQYVTQNFPTYREDQDPMREASQRASLGGVSKDRIKVQRLLAPYAMATRALQAADNSPTRNSVGFSGPLKVIEKAKPEAIATCNKRVA